MSEEPIIIATPEYFPALMDATRAGHEENGQHTISLVKCAHTVWRGVTRQQALMGVIGDPFLVQAFISLEIDPIYYSEDMGLFEKILFVRKEFRKSSHASRLLDFAKHISDELGLELTTGIISDIRLEAKARLYQRKLQKGGVWFVHRPRKQESAEVNGQ